MRCDSQYLVVTDLDGTIMTDTGKIHLRDVDALARLKAAGHLTAIATGRIHYAALKFIPADLALDYVVYSMGNGIMDWRTKEIVFQRSIERELLLDVLEVVSRYNTSYIIHLLPPKSEVFYYQRHGRYQRDFERRLSRLRHNGRLLRSHDELPHSVSQLLIILDSEQAYLDIKQGLQGMNVEVNRSTSPVDHTSIWMEIFAPGVNKSSGVDWLASKHGISAQNVVAVGNDYNDLDMLDYAGNAFIVKNAPPQIRGNYTQTDSVGNAGFSKAVIDFFKL